MLVHLLDGQMQHLPQVQLGEFSGHLLGEDPRGNGGAVHDLRLQHFVYEDYHHLLVRVPQLKHVAQDADLGFLRFCQYLKIIYEKGMMLNSTIFIY